METTYTVMRGWRDGEQMQQHLHGGPFNSFEEAAKYADCHGGYVRRDSDGSTLAPDGSEWIDAEAA